MSTRKWIAVLGVTPVVLFFALGVWRDSGPTHSFSLPDAITVVEGEAVTERSVAFPNLLPGETSASFPVEPTFKIGDVVEVDLRAAGISKTAPWEFRVQEPADYNVVRQTFYFHTEALIPDGGTVRLRIIGYDSEESEAFHQNDWEHWFWLQQFFEVEVIG